MGIDAELMIRVRREQSPTRDELKRWSWDLCQSIGASNFFASPGLQSKDYEPAIKAWYEAFDAHPKSGAFRNADGQDRTTLHQAILADIGKPPEEERLAIGFPRHYSEEGSKLAPGKVFSQDGPDIFAEEGEWLLRVSMWTRYYGPGYERGDILTICATAEWIEANIPNSEVWYGGDSSGVLMEPFGIEERAAMRKHLYSPNGRDYFAAFERRESFPTPAPCSMCIEGENRFNRHGWGNDYVAVNCAGCGKNFESRDGGKTWEIKKDN